MVNALTSCYWSWFNTDNSFPVNNIKVLSHWIEQLTVQWESLGSSVQIWGRWNFSWNVSWSYLLGLSNHWFGWSETTRQTKSCWNTDYSQVSFTSLWTKRPPTKKEAPAPKSRPSSSNKVCGWAHGQKKSLLENVLWSDETNLRCLATMTKGAEEHRTNCKARWWPHHTLGLFCINWMVLFKKNHPISKIQILQHNLEP